MYLVANYCIQVLENTREKYKKILDVIVGIEYEETFIAILFNILLTTFCPLENEKNRFSKFKYVSNRMFSSKGSILFWNLYKLFCSPAAISQILDIESLWILNFYDKNK